VFPVIGGHQVEHLYANIEISLSREQTAYHGKHLSVRLADNFDLVHALPRVHEALASPDSVWSGPKSFVYALREEVLGQPPQGVLKRGQRWSGRGTQEETPHLTDPAALDDVRK